ncbi:MAG: Gfo/Idh/MocA family oxidoreductase [Armatimonadetes bacterium]|nr:Gfo/Idh/MocA family oxidoreductase [Armatimonadota bacterium]
MDRKIKIAVAGCGNIFRILHGPVFAAFRDQVEVVAIADREFERAEAAARPFGARAFVDVEEMLDKVGNDLDILYILTYLTTHHTMAHMAIDRGINFFVEKPFAVTLNIIDDIIEKAAKAGVHFEVGENFPLFPNDQAFYKIIREGLIGDVEKIFLLDPINPFGIHMAVHRISQFRLCAPGTISRVQAMALDAHDIPVPPVAGSASEYMRCDPGRSKTVFAKANFTDGSTGTLISAPIWSWKNPVESPFVRCREVVGTKGSVGDNLWPTNHGELRDNTVYLEIGPEDNRARVPVVREMAVVGGVEVVQRIVVGTEKLVIWENLFKDRPLDDWRISGAMELKSLMDAVLYDQQTAYGSQARIDTELNFAMLESERLGCRPISLPLATETHAEREMIRDLQRMVAGRIENTV